MGYFSDLDLCNENDRSYYGYEDQCELRLEELYGRLSELVALGAPYRTGESLGEADYRYALPSRFCTVYDVERAIEASRDGAESRRGESEATYRHREPYAEGYEPYADAQSEAIPGQMSIFEVVLITPVTHRAA